MEILSHRGYWKTAAEKNTETAFRRSFSLGFGTETDLRDCNGEIVISHDPPIGSELSFEGFLEIYKEYESNLPLALNIKADGLQREVQTLLIKYNVTNYFVFDMSVPDQLLYHKLNYSIFTRQSEYEKHPPLYEQAIGVWIDQFHDDWIQLEDIQNHISNRKRICFVSPDLHGRNYKEFWKKINHIGSILNSNFMICTDHPDIAKNFFA